MVRYIYQDQKRDLYNKSLQLTPWRLVRTAHAVLKSRRRWVDTAGQLNSMLYISWLISIRKEKEVELNNKNTNRDRPVNEARSNPITYSSRSND